jgi:hypothetical protein
MAATIPKGAKTVDLGGVEHEIGCPLHRGAVVERTEQREDPATGKPRLVMAVDASGVERPVLDDQGEEVVAEFPVYTEDVGYQTDCDPCLVSRRDAVLHARAKRDSAVQALHEDLQKARRERELARAGSKYANALDAMIEHTRGELEAELEKGIE